MPSNRTGVALCLACLAGWIGVYSISRLSADDEKRGPDGCPLETAKIGASWVFAIDATDMISAAAMTRISEQLVALIDSGHVNDRFAVHVVDGNAQTAATPWKTRAGKSYVRCKTIDQAHINKAVETERVVLARYAATMLTPLREMLEDIRALPGSKRSPLIGSIESLLWADAWHQAKDRRLVFVSDMLENSTLQNQLRNGIGKYCDVVTSSQGDRLRSQGFAGLKLTILYQRNGTFLERQGSAHLAYYKNLAYALAASEVRVGDQLLKNDTPRCLAPGDVRVLNPPPPPSAVKRISPATGGRS